MDSGGKKAAKVDELLEEGMILYGIGKFEEAGRKWRQALQIAPGNPSAEEYLKILKEDLEKPAAEKTRAERLDEYKNILGDLNRAPVMAIDYEQVKKLDLNHQEGFILSQIDGRITFGEILDLAGMDNLEAMGTLARFVSSGIIKVG